MRPRSCRLWAAALGLMVAAAGAAPSFALEIKRVKLANGATLLVSEQHQLPMVTAAIAFDAGSRRDPPGKDGLAALTAQCLTEGTRELSAAELDRKIDFMGSSLSVSAGQDYGQAGFTSLTRYAGDTLHLLGQVLTRPGLRDDDILRKRAETVAGLKSENERPGYVADLSFTGLLFGDRPYGHLPDGTVDSVGKLTPGDVRDFYRAHYQLGDAVIAVVGDVKAEEVKASLERELKGLEGTAAAQPAPEPPKVAPGAHLTKIDRAVTQANLILGFGGIARSNPDYYRLQVMNYILGGGGFSSRLVSQVRSKAGLAYSVASFFDAGLFPGSFEVSLQTKNRSANQAIGMVLQQLREIQEKPVTDAELESARKFLIGSFPLKIDRQSAIAHFLLQVELYGLGLDYAERYPKLIAAVTREDVQRVARQYLHPDAFILVAVANQGQAAIEVAAREHP